MIFRSIFTQQKSRISENIYEFMFALNGVQMLPIPAAGLCMMAADAVNSGSERVNAACGEVYEVFADQFLFIRGLLAIENNRLFSDSPAVNKLWSGNFDEMGDFDLLGDMRRAFELPNVVRLSCDVECLGKQERLIERIVAAARDNAGIMMLLGLMKERLGFHYYHGLRAGVVYSFIREQFDPRNSIPDETLILVGVLHDAGKLEVPEDILFKDKDDEFSPEEMDAMKRHNDATWRILVPFQRAFDHIADVATLHHPYYRHATPAVVATTHIQQAGLFLCIADSYDGLASRRNYREAYPRSVVASIMHKRFYLYPDMVECLLDVFPCPVT